jgi:hypothetical protein
MVILTPDRERDMNLVVLEFILEFTKPFLARKICEYTFMFTS